MAKNEGLWERKGPEVRKCEQVRGECEGTGQAELCSALEGPDLEWLWARDLQGSFFF